MNRPRTTTRQKLVNSKIETTVKGNPKIENLAKTNTGKIENSVKVSTSNTKITSKFAPSENQITKKDTNRKKNINTLSRKLSDNYLNEPTIEKEKVTSEKKTPILKSLQTIGQKNIKILRDQSIINKIESNKRETDNKDPISNKTSEIKMNKFQNKAKKIDTKTSNVSIKMMDDKVNNTKPKSTPAPKIKTNEKSVTPKLKSKGKTKKIGQSKSTILSTTSDLLIDNSAIKDDSFDLADLIEASLKSIRSPRSIFDYNFSCIDKPKSCGGDTLAQEISRKMSDHPRAPKSGHAKASLDRLSEKSEPLTAKSVDSVNKIERARAIATPRYLKGLSADLKKSIELSKSRGIMSLDEKVLDQFEKYTYNKYSTPSIQDDAEQKKFTPRKEMDKINILRSLGTKNFHSKNLNSNNAMNEINRYDAKKNMTMNNVYKYL